ncbi:hypothetical protein PIROE2DRAFT_14856, partial [Piromyces sp. E2]
ILIAANIGGGGESWKYIVSIALTVIALLCTGLGCWGAYKNNTQHVTWYFYYSFVNLCFAVVDVVLNIINLNIGMVIVSGIHLIIAIYTVTIVKGFLGNLNGNSAAAAV